MSDSSQSLIGRIFTEWQSPGKAQRTALFERIERLTGRVLLAYVALPEAGPAAMIHFPDIDLIVEALRTLPSDRPLDLLLNTPGGLPDVAQHLMAYLRSRHSRVRVLVPNMAKSAGTLMALAADAIVMGPPSQLGPIDPQLPYKGQLLPAHAVVDSHRTFLKDLRKRGNVTPVDWLQLQQFDPALMDYAQKAIEEAQRVARTWLKQGMLQHSPSQAAKTARRLAQNRGSHAQAITAAEARDEYGLTIEALTWGDPLWDAVWELYVWLTFLARQQQAAKVIATSAAELTIRVANAPTPPHANSPAPPAPAPAPAMPPAAPATPESPPQPPDAPPRTPE
jgi:hypothetical protein